MSSPSRDPDAVWRANRLLRSDEYLFLTPYPRARHLGAMTDVFPTVYCQWSRLLLSHTLVVLCVCVPPDLRFVCAPVALPEGRALDAAATNDSGGCHAGQCHRSKQMTRSIGSCFSTGLVRRARCGRHAETSSPSPSAASRSTKAYSARVPSAKGSLKRPASFPPK